MENQPAKTNHRDHTNKKLLISDGVHCKYVTAHMLADLACISVKHAYKIMKDPSKMTPTIHKLVTMQLLGSIPGWPPGWGFLDDKLHSPNGHKASLNQIENIDIFLSLEKEYINKIDSLTNEISDLRKPRIASINTIPKLPHPGLTLVK